MAKKITRSPKKIARKATSMDQSTEEKADGPTVYEHVEFNYHSPDEWQYGYGDVTVIGPESHPGSEMLLHIHDSFGNGVYCSIHGKCAKTFYTGVLQKPQLAGASTSYGSSHAQWAYVGEYRYVGLWMEDNVQWAFTFTLDPKLLKQSRNR